MWMGNKKGMCIWNECWLLRRYQVPRPVLKEYPMLIETSAEKELSRRPLVAVNNFCPFNSSLSCAMAESSENACVYLRI